MDGGQVFDLWQAGDVAAVRAYNAGDVAAVRGCWHRLNWEAEAAA